MRYTTSLFCEFDKYAAESYCAVHDTAPELNIGDITKADEKSVPDFNTMFGGSPCQDYAEFGITLTSLSQGNRGGCMDM